MHLWSFILLTQKIHSFILQIQVDLEQHGFELHSSTYMWIFLNKYSTVNVLLFLVIFFFFNVGLKLMTFVCMYGWLSLRKLSLRR